MPNTFTTNTFATTYKDDFIDSDNYHRILFNAGRALQARELTQMQTIIQEEIARFGRNIFKDGGSVNPGGPTINNDYEFVKLDTAAADRDLPTDTSVLVGGTITGGTSVIKARVLEVVAATASDPATLFVQYTEIPSGLATTTGVRFTPGEDITVSFGDPASTDTFKVQGTDTPSNPAVGKGCRISNAAGDFFARGHFVFAKPQSLILSKYTRLPTKVVGFKITEDIITTSDDAALFDNQGATPNLSSPGADRYRILLTLTTQDQVNSDENFVFYCNVVEGDIVDQVSGTESYNKINEVLAERTREESGNYIVSPFSVDFEDSATDFIANVSDGIAYINGYRGATETPTEITIPKPRATVELENETVGVNYGNYFVCDTVEGALDSATSGKNFSTVSLRSATGHGGSTIGTAKFRYLEKDGSNFRVYLFDVSMNSGQALRDVKSLGHGAADFANIVLTNNKAVPTDNDKVNLVYTTPNPRPKDITDEDFEVQRIFTGTTNGSGNLTLSSLGTGETFVNSSQWIVTANDSGSVRSPTIDTSAGTSATLTGDMGDASGVTVYAKVNKAQANFRQKTLVETTFTGKVLDSAGQPNIGLGTITPQMNIHATDLFQVIAIKENDSDGRDISHLFTVDNGQRPGFYDNARLVLEDGTSIPTANVFVRFKHFTHGGTGDFFSVNSYTGQVDYEDIPNFATGPRTSVNLRDVIDFRSSVDSAGTFTGTGAAVHEVPTNGDIFQADVEYYLPRSDKIIVNTEGEVKNIQGENGFESQVPITPENTQALFEVRFNGYGLNDSDMSVTPIRAKRFTMKDIEGLERRVDKLEEVTSLSLLESKTANLLVLDDSDNPRTKSGFFVDNFQDRTFSDVLSSEYRAAIDPSRQILRPPQIEDNVNLVYDSANSSNTILKGDIVYLNHGNKESITQTRITEIENVNPFAVITNEGNITLSPTSDEWQETKYKPSNVVNRTAEEDLGVFNEGNLATGTANRRGFSNFVNAFAWGSPFGTFIPLVGFGVITDLNIFGGWAGVNTWNSNGVSRVGQQRVGRNIVSTFEQRVVVGERTITEVIGDRTVSLTFLPFIRSRKVFFKAEGLRPNTLYFPFFNNKEVKNFCREETFQRTAANDASGAIYGSKFRNRTAHPQGTTDLITDASGVIEGSFFIPSNKTKRFRAGTREFKLLDISVNNEANALSRASTNYFARGTLDTRQKTIASTRVTTVRTNRWTESQRVRRVDPLAQSFMVTNPSGMFVTRVQTYFKKKDTAIPVRMEIRPMVNGAPSSTEIVPGGVKFLNPSAVNVAASQTQTSALASPTTFEFDEPVFLNPDTEYAIVLLAESINYEAYVAETYAFELGSTEKRISRQPSMGSLFKSQNGTTWEPDQTKDLAFKIFEAEFSTAGGFATFVNQEPEDELLEANPFYADSGDATITAFYPNHGFVVGNTVNIRGLDSNTKFNGLLGGNFQTTKTITKVDGFGIQFEADSNATASGRFGGDNVTLEKQIIYDIATPNLSTLVPEDTTLTLSAKYTRGKSLAETTDNSFQRDTTFTNEVIIGDENIFTESKMIATTANETASLGSGVKSVEYKVNMNTTRANVSPVIDVQRASITTARNQIDKQASGAATGFNVPINFVAETNAFGGSSLAKHMTTVTNLSEPAVGLKIILAAIRPTNSDFELYFRTAIDGEDIFSKDFTLQAAENTQAPDPNNFREYRYLIGGFNGNLAAFTQFQIKIVMRATNSATPPIFKDLRAIALAV